jgi:GTP-binding protein Era
MSDHKTGYVAILGLPNAGKSTLLNALLGQKLSIITSKPQTTRKRILGILSEENYQVIFLDNPGILSPSYLLQEKMMDEVGTSVKDADIIVLMLDIGDDFLGKKLMEQEFVKKYVLNSPKEKLLILNKVDLITQEKVNELIKHFESNRQFKSVIPVSASLNFNIRRVLEEIIELLPEGPKLFPDEYVTDKNERFFVSEIIREKILELFRDEVPYSCEVLIADFKERSENKDFISAEIIVEKDSQKAIIIGKNGTAIKKLGSEAREAIEKFLEREVFLELRVKVKKKWRSDEKMLKSFGYSGKEKD